MAISRERELQRIKGRNPQPPQEVLPEQKISFIEGKVSDANIKGIVQQFLAEPPQDQLYGLPCH